MSTSPAPGTSSPVGASPSADPSPRADPAVPAKGSAPSVRSLRSWAIATGQSLLCLGIGLFIFLIMLGDLLFEFDDAPPQSLLVLAGADALVGLVLSLAIGPLRFLRPGRAHAAAHLVLVAAGGLSSWSLPATAIALYRIGLRRRLVLDAAALVVLTGVVAGWTSLDSHLRGTSDTRLFLATLGVMLVLALVPLLVGRVVGTRHELIRTLRERAASAERESASAERERASAERERVSAEQARASAQREADALRLGQDAEAARVRAEERAALARDMHDSVSHHLSAIAMHAGAMAYREDLDPETLRRTATTVRDAAQQANRELREVLVALRTTSDAAPLASLPTLQETVERARAHGQQVDLDLSGLAPEDFEQLGRGTVVALARILAEGLTNAAKHSPGAPVSVALARREEQVVLTVRNPLTGADAGNQLPQPALSTGHGLVGVEERARLLGGGARCSRTGRGFEMEAWMPW
jgi:signal transduction histidine kinase